MIDFNLERALAGAKLVTRDGGEVTHFSSTNDLKFPYAFYIGEGRYTVTKEGKLFSNQDTSLDLFMSEEEEEVFAPKPGDVVEVSIKNCPWRVRTFLFTLGDTHYCILQQENQTPTKIATGKSIASWPRIRKHVERHTVKVIIDGVTRMDEEMTQEELDEKFIL